MEGKRENKKRGKRERGVKWKSGENGARQKLPLGEEIEKEGTQAGS